MKNVLFPSLFNGKELGFTNELTEKSSSLLIRFFFLRSRFFFFRLSCCYYCPEAECAHASLLVCTCAVFALSASVCCVCVQTHSNLWWEHLSLRDNITRELAMLSYN